MTDSGRLPAFAPAAPVVGPEGQVWLPFRPEFQNSLLVLLGEDGDFSRAVGKYLTPHHWPNPAHAWAYGVMKDYAQKHDGAFPKWPVVLEHLRGLDPAQAFNFEPVLQGLRDTTLREPEFIREMTVDFCRRVIFYKSMDEQRRLMDANKPEEAYDLAMRNMVEIQALEVEAPDQEWFFENFDQRMAERLNYDITQESVSTGFPWLDKVLGGGLPLGEVGMWMAYPKTGKTTMLTALGVNGTRSFRRVIHFVLESKRKQVAARYDAAFLEYNYGLVKRGEIDHVTLERAKYEYDQLKEKLVLRGVGNREWVFSILNVQQVLQDLKRQHNWAPELLIVDYLDLLSGTQTRYNAEHEKQADAARALKTLAGRGPYSVWTATQPQRPPPGVAEKERHLVSARIGGAYEKVRAMDFIGSLNMTQEEKDAKVMRLYAELYRDNAANKEVLVRADFSKMLIREEPDILDSPSFEDAKPSHLMGFKQSMAPL